MNDLQIINFLYQLKQSIGGALSEEQQLFVSAHYGNLINFTNSDAGKKAVSDFVDAWFKVMK